MSAFSDKLVALDLKFRSIAAERYALLLLIPSAIVVLALGSAIYFWDIDGPFRVRLYPQATVIWVLALPLAFFSYEGLVAAWRSELSLTRKLAFSTCHLAAIALSLAPLFFFLLVVWAIGGDHGDR